MSALLVGYARVSTHDQDLTAQRDALAALGVSVERTYVDHGLTGTNRDRPGLREALAACRSGDTLVVTKLDSKEVALGSLPYARNRQAAILGVLPDIAAPIVAINPATAPTDIASLRRHGVEPTLLEDVGHFPMIEAPDRFNAVLAATLASFGS